MKIFPKQESVKGKASRTGGDNATVKKGSKGKKHAVVPEREQISDREIREKLAAHVETSNTAKSVTLKKNTQKLGDGFMNPEAISQQKMTQPLPQAQAETETDSDDSKKDILLKTDINLNDPKDPNTQEKLKTVLSTGAFSFNARERETLDKILNGN